MSEVIIIKFIHETTISTAAWYFAGVRCACRHCRLKKCLEVGMDRRGNFDITLFFYPICFLWDKMLPALNLSNTCSTAAIQNDRDRIGYTKRTRKNVKNMDHSGNTAYTPSPTTSSDEGELRYMFITLPETFWHTFFVFLHISIYANWIALWVIIIQPSVFPSDRVFVFFSHGVLLNQIWRVDFIVLCTAGSAVLILHRTISSRLDTTRFRG